MCYTIKLYMDAFLFHSDGNGFDEKNYDKYVYLYWNVWS